MKIGPFHRGLGHRPTITASRSCERQQHDEQEHADGPAARTCSFCPLVFTGDAHGSNELRIDLGPVAWRIARIAIPIASVTVRVGCSIREDLGPDRCPNFIRTSKLTGIHAIRWLMCSFFCYTSQQGRKS